MQARIVIERHLERSARTLQALAEVAPRLEQAAALAADALAAGGRLLVCGNGGSAAQSQHLAAELVVRLRSQVDRRALAAISLTVDTSILTACANDYGYERVFARQVEALGRAGDVLVGLSTSGRSPNVLAALKAAHEQQMGSVLLTGAEGEAADEACDVLLAVPETDTMFIQEGHLAIVHLLCDLIERRLFPERFV